MRQLLSVFFAVALGICTLTTSNSFAQNAEEAKAIAKEAYTYGFPLVEGYKTLHKQALDPDGSDFKAPINQVGHAAGVATPSDKQFVTPNTDTPYSFLWADLRAEPIVITMPKIEAERYYTGQMIDLYTHNFAYLGTRAFGNDGGNFLITGPGWEGEKPDGIRAVIPCETEIFYVLFRTQLFESSELSKVKAIQAGITAQPLSSFLGKPAPKVAPAIDWPAPKEGMTETPEMFSYLNSLLQFTPTHPSEKELMERFAKLGIGAGKDFAFATYPEEMKAALKEGIAEFWKEDFEATMKRMNAGEIGSPDFFGTRDYLKNNYLYRFMGAKLGLYGNSREEAVYPTYFVDADGKTPDASANTYTIRFEKGQLPPAGAFWSVTMYDGKSQLLVENPLKRYLLNSTMLESFKPGDDGSLTLYVQNTSPGADLEPNWLPAPAGPFYCIMRIYLPKPIAIDGTWKAPLLRKVKDQKNVGEDDVDTGVGENGVAKESSPSFEKGGVPVDMFNIVRAETAKYFAEETILSGGNTMRHERTGIDLENQTVIRSNFDLIYSYGVYDVSGGLEIKVPDYDLYQIVHVFDENHVTLAVVYPGDTVKLTQDDVTYGEHIYLFMRTQRRTPDEKGLKELNKRQDAVVIKNGSAKPYVSEVKYDPVTFNKLRAHLIGPYGIKNAIIHKGFVDDLKDIVFPHYQMVNLGGWAGLPAKHAFYFVVVPGDEAAKKGKPSSMTFRPPPVMYEKNGYWSLTLYDKQGWVKTDTFNTNSYKAKPNADGSFTLHFNTPGAINNLEVVENWNGLFRCYLPESVDEILKFKAEVIESLPKAEK